MEDNADRQLRSDRLTSISVVANMSILPSPQYCRCYWNKQEIIRFFLRDIIEKNIYSKNKKYLRKIQEIRRLIIESLLMIRRVRTFADRFRRVMRSKY